MDRRRPAMPRQQQRSQASGNQAAGQSQQRSTGEQ
jgi:hypothetical protein